jgi:hypothetical protein
MELSNKFKLTLQERENVIKMYTEGTSVISLAEQYGVSRPTIYNIIEKVKHPNKKIDFYFDKSDENKDMSNLTVEQNNINFLGVKIDTENGSSNPKIRKALDKSFQLLDIMKFIEVTKFKLNMTMFDYFWQVVVGNVTHTLVGMSVLKWFGYDGSRRNHRLVKPSEYYKQRQNFKKMLINNNIPHYELTQKDKEIEQYPTIQEELQLVPSNVKHTKFLIMEPDDLKMAIMQLKTKNGHIIRQYYIDLEKLLKMYVEYTLYFNHRESQRKITDLEQMMSGMRLDMKKQEEIMQQQTSYMRSLGISLEEVKDQNHGLHKQVKKVQRKLGIAVEDRAPQPEDHGPKDHDRDPAKPDRDESKRERFVLIKRNDPDYYLYFTIRAQNDYTERKLKFEKTHFPQMVVLLDFKCSPNSKTLFNRIKETLKAKNVTFKGNNIDLEDTDITTEELMDEMKVINEARKEV